MSLVDTLVKSGYRYHALACDYDGTLAKDGKVGAAVIAALVDLQQSGRKLILVTGRRLEELLAVFPHAYLFNSIVCENGAVIYKPDSKSTRVLTDAVPSFFIERLKQKGVEPIDVGHVIAATWHPHENAVLATIEELGLDLQICFNKGAVMILPAGINKASGLNAALHELGLSRHNVVGVGDAENDYSFLKECECAVAVANALPNLKAVVDIVTSADHGEGVVEIIRHMLLNDLVDFVECSERHRILLGTTVEEKKVWLKPFNTGMLISGPSKAGKSTICMTVLEHLESAGYQYCVIDPEGDYDLAPGATVVPFTDSSRTISEVLHALDNPQSSVVVNLLGMPFEERPIFFARLFSTISKMRVDTGRPHWLIVDEAHHMLHPYWIDCVEPIWDEKGMGFIMITVDPEQISSKVLSSIDLALAVGRDTKKTLDAFADIIGQRKPEHASGHLGWGQAILWSRHLYEKPIKITIADSLTTRVRHLRKYAEGNVGSERSFYFTGPDRRLKLRAQNLQLFMQIGDGVDDETWLYHLKKGDYSNWFHEVINDNRLADGCKKIEGQKSLKACESRSRIRQLIERFYTLPGTFELHP
jgi:HAD superfamily hydrolase (TIGR01484 family)